MRNRTTLTGRGWALLICGTAATIGAAVLGELDLMWLGLAIAALPAIALGYLLLAQPRVTYQRLLQPHTVPVGSTSRVVLDALNEAPAQGSAIRFTDSAPVGIGGGASFVIARGFGRWRQAVGYTIQADQRGRFTIGPLVGIATDPLALAQSRHTATGEASTLRVTPYVWPLTDLMGGAGMGTASDATPQRLGAAGQDDILVREHRSGDDIRRVHWKMSAKHGELMVRLEEHPWDPSSTLIIDTRSSAHLGRGPKSSLEWAVSAITSVAALLVAGRNKVTILSPGGMVFETAHLLGDTAHQAMVEEMTDLQATEETELKISDEETLSASPALVAATGLLNAKDAAALAAAGSRARKRIALVVDARAWGRQNTEHEEACRLLRSNGWQICLFGPGQPFPEVWGRAV